MSAVVYRVFDRNGALLYIGSTRSLNARKAIHMADRKSPIAFPLQTCAARWETQEFATYEEANAAEIAAIEAEAPYLNRQHNPKRWRKGAGVWESLMPPYVMAWPEVSDSEREDVAKVKRWMESLPKVVEASA